MHHRLIAHRLLTPRFHQGPLHPNKPLLLCLIDRLQKPTIPLRLLWTVVILTLQVFRPLSVAATCRLGWIAPVGLTLTHLTWVYRRRRPVDLEKPILRLCPVGRRRSAVKATNRPASLVVDISHPSRIKKICQTWAFLCHCQNLTEISTLRTTRKTDWRRPQAVPSALIILLRTPPRKRASVFASARRPSIVWQARLRSRQPRQGSAVPC